MSDCAVPSRFERSARLSECCKTSRHRLLNVFQHLRTHWHLQLLSDFVTYTSCRRGRYQHPFDKEQTFFLVQLCLAVFRLDLVRKEQCTSVCTKITPVPLLSETTKRQNYTWESTRIVRTSGRLYVTSRPPSCWSRAPLAVWISGTGNGTPPVLVT